jgi:glucan phosphoethanolaminetransferase (alkaline phosphatase superfamily)
MKRRSASFNYILTLLTGGQFGLAWLFLMASDINKEQPSFVPKLRAFTVAFAALYVIYALSVGYNMYQIGTATAETYPLHSARTIPMAPLFFIAIGLMAYAIYLLVKIGAFVRARGASAPSNAVLVLLFFAYLISLPLLQNRLNALHGRHT